jgi:Zn-dependent peptidase ImmA (M78 family)/DNA-binding XRE family transcriptional regulator
MATVEAHAKIAGAGGEIGVMGRDVGARVRQLREAVGLQAQDLATQVGLDPTTISKIENGKRAIKTFELSWIAEALNVSPLALLEDVPLLSSLPVAAHCAGSGLTHGGVYRRLLGLSELHIVLAEAGIPTSPRLWGAPDVLGLPWLEGAKRLTEWAVHQLPVRAEGDQRFDALADAIEERLKIDVLVEPYFDDALSGAAITDRSFPLIFINSDYPRPRSIFTLAHELGHILAGPVDEVITLDRELSGSTDAERMANAFAASLLMPEDMIRGEVQRRGRRISTLVDLTYRLGVSFESLVYRLYNLRLINAEGRDRLRAIRWQRLSSYLDDATLSAGLPSEEIGRLQYRDSAKPAHRPPVLLLRRAYEGYQKGFISVRPLAGLMRVDPEQLLDQLEADGDFLASIREVDSLSFGEVDPAESPEELFGGSPV